MAFDGPTLFEDVDVVDGGPCSATSTAAWTPAMLTIVLRCPELARTDKRCIYIICACFLQP